MLVDIHGQKKLAREKKNRLGRARLCFGCAGDAKPLGYVASESACDGCGRAPCHGVIVQR